MVIDERECRREEIAAIARQIMIAGRTAPKGKGIDIIEIVTIVGASGAGKSTLLHILGTLDTPDEGELLYDSVNIARLSSNKLSEFRNNNIGFVFQFHHLLPEFTALRKTSIRTSLVRSI